LDVQIFRGLRNSVLRDAELSLPDAARYRPLDMTPQHKKEKTFEA
jgi:hypothetical protein